jgi:hypothetical protein
VLSGGYPQLVDIIAMRRSTRRAEINDSSQLVGRKASLKKKETTPTWTHTFGFVSSLSSAS